MCQLCKIAHNLYSIKTYEALNFTGSSWASTCILNTKGVMFYSQQVQLVVPNIINNLKKPAICYFSACPTSAGVTLGACLPFHAWGGGWWGWHWGHPLTGLWWAPCWGMYDGVLEWDVLRRRRRRVVFQPAGHLPNTRKTPLHYLVYIYLQTLDYDSGGASLLRGPHKIFSPWMMHKCAEKIWRYPSVIRFSSLRYSLKSTNCFDFQLKTRSKSASLWYEECKKCGHAWAVHPIYHKGVH